MLRQNLVTNGNGSYKVLLNFVNICSVAEAGGEVFITKRWQNIAVGCAQRRAEAFMKCCQHASFSINRWPLFDHTSPSARADLSRLFVLAARRGRRAVLKIATKFCSSETAASVEH